MITCGFIGLGLIGGSIARAFKQNREDIPNACFAGKMKDMPGG